MSHAASMSSGDKLRSPTSALGVATETYMVDCVMEGGLSGPQSGTGLPLLSTGRGIGVSSAKVLPGLKQV